MKFETSPETILHGRPTNATETSDNSAFVISYTPIDRYMPNFCKKVMAGVRSGS